MVDMASVSSERGFSFSAHPNPLLTELRESLSDLLAAVAAPTGFIRRKYVGAALLALCGVYAGGLLSLYTPLLNSGMTDRSIPASHRNLSGRPVSESAILAPRLVQTDFAVIPEIGLVKLDLQKIEVEPAPGLSLQKSDRVFGTAALRKATDHVLSQAPNGRAAIPVPRMEPSIPAIGQLAAPQVMVAMMLKGPKDVAASNARPKSFGESQRIIDTQDPSNLAFAKNDGATCGGFRAGRQGSDFAHGVKGTNSGFGHRSGTGIGIPELNWKWCAL
jgi:hypothetical protein